MREQNKEVGVLSTQAACLTKALVHLQEVVGGLAERVTKVRELARHLFSSFSEATPNEVILDGYWVPVVEHRGRRARRGRALTHAVDQFVHFIFAAFSIFLL